MCTAETLKRAASNLKHGSERRKAEDIARRLTRGKNVSTEEIAWAKRITAKVRGSHRAHA